MNPSEARSSTQKQIHSLGAQREEHRHPVPLTRTAACSCLVRSWNLLLPLLPSPVPQRKTSFHIKLKRKTKTRYIWFSSKQMSIYLVFSFITLKSSSQKKKLFAQLGIHYSLNCLFWTYLLPGLLRGREGSRQCNGARLVVSIQYQCMRACSRDT